MKFILLYRGRLGNQNFRLFETREEAHNYSRSEGMIDKEIFGVFELLFHHSFNKTSVGRSE